MLRLLLAPALFLPAALPAEEILTASFAGASPSATVPWTATTALRPGLGYSGWVRGAGVLPRPTADRYGFNVNAPGDHESTLVEALAEDEYLGFVLAPSAPLDLGLTQVTFTIQRDSYHAPRRFAVLSSVGGFAPDSPVLFASARQQSEDEGPRTFAFFLPREGFQGLTAPVEFRLYAYGANFNHPASLNAWSIATFDGAIHTVSVSSGDGGTATLAPEKTLFATGETVAFTATPAEGQRFAGWRGSRTGLGNPLVLNVDADLALTATFEPIPRDFMAIGMNLGEVNDYGSDWPFTDFFRRTRYWMTRSVGGSEFNSNHSADIPLRPDGYPTEVPFNVPGTATPQIAHSILVEPGPPGDRALTVQGTGRIRLNSSGINQVIDLNGPPRRLTFTADGSAPVIFEIHLSDTADPIRNIHLLPTEFEAAPPDFHPLYRERLEPFAGPLRFMDWQRTNGQDLEQWARRTPSDLFTQSHPAGVALETIADFANTMRRDAWICVPHRADDDWVRQAARLLRDRLDPALRLWVEYSNETWNTAGPFTQTTYVQDRGQELGLDADRWRAGQYFAAVRSAQVWAIFRQEFGADADRRLVEVLATQSAGPAVTQMRAQALNNPALNPDRAMPRALAVAPYFGNVYTPQDIASGGYPSADDLATTTSVELIQALRSDLRAQRDIAAAQGWRLVCYEGGQHYVGVFGAENDTDLTEILTAANRDPRMAQRYTEYLDMLREEGVEVFANFSYVGEWGRYGSWGVLERQEQSSADAPKYRALTDWLTRQAAASLNAWIVK